MRVTGGVCAALVEHAKNMADMTTTVSARTLMWYFFSPRSCFPLQFPMQGDHLSKRVLIRRMDRNARIRHAQERSQQPFSPQPAHRVPR